jgi:hypothetical protein
MAIAAEHTNSVQAKSDLHGDFHRATLAAMPQSTDHSKRDPTAATEVISVATYEKLHEFIAAFARAHLNLLILIGNPGLAKTRIVRAALGHNACWIEGNATAFGLYRELYHHRESPYVVIDDVDSLYSDRIGVRLLKSLCQTELIKTVAWHSGARSLEKEGIPTKFETRAKVLVISNDWRALNRNVVALQDRGFVLHFQPTAEEVHRQARAWFSDTAVYDWFTEHLHLIREPSLRHYVRAAMLKDAGMDWSAVLPSSSGNPKERLVAELLADSRYASQESRAREFVARRAGCRRTYFNYAKRLGMVD